MTKVKIATDSNSGITQQEAKKLGISVLPMPFLINGEEYFEDINLTQAEFYEKLGGNANVSTSQPSTINVAELWDSLLEEDCEIVYIPMSSGLSESCHTAENLAKNYKGKVYVINNQRISLTQKQSVFDALLLAERGMSAADIAAKLMETKLDASIYIALDTLKYLKKGGRLTPAAALIGTLFKIRPVLQIQGEKLDAYVKVHTLRHAKAAMIDAVRNDFETRFKEYVEKGEMTMAVAHTDNEEQALKFMEELRQAFPNIPVTHADPLSLSVSCHIGPGALAVATSRKVL